MLGSTVTNSPTPTIRDLVRTLRGSPGVEAAVIIGRDGLVIDGSATAGVDLEHIAAHIPALVGTADEVSAHAARGALVTAVLEYERSAAIVTSLSQESLLFVLLAQGANLGPILFDIRSHRSQMAALI